MSRSGRLESNTSSTRQAAAQRTRYRDEPDLQQRDSFALDEERTQLTIGGRRVPQDPDDWFDKPWKDFSYREIAYLLLRNAMFFPDYLYPSPNRKPVTPQRRRRLLFSYAPDWIITIGLWIALYFIDKVDGFRREFSITDTSLQHTYAVNERIPVYALGLMCLFPVIVYAAIGLGIMRSVWVSPLCGTPCSAALLNVFCLKDFHSAVLGEVLSLALTISVTTIVKVLVGRPRPDILDRCQPVEGAANAIPYGLVTSAICTTDNLKRLKEGFRSFPSGHASSEQFATYQVFFADKSYSCMGRTRILWLLHRREAASIRSTRTHHQSMDRIGAILRSRSRGIIESDGLQASSNRVSRDSLRQDTSKMLNAFIQHHRRIAPRSRFRMVQLPSVLPAIDP